MSKLTRMQKKVMDDMFGNKSIQSALSTNKISRGVFRRWLDEERWQEEFNRRIEELKQQSRIDQARYKTEITSKLLNLTECGNQATARLACKDILDMEQKAAKTNLQSHRAYAYGKAMAGGPDERVFKPEVARKMLEVLAEARDKYGEIFTTRRQLMMEEQKG